MKKLVVCCCCLALMACAKKSNVREAVSPADFVAVTLGDAAQTAHSELAMLSRLRGQGVQLLMPPADPSLTQAVSIAWTGPAEGALKELCLQLGYRYQALGTPTAQELTVVVRGLNRPAHVLLEDIAW